MPRRRFAALLRAGAVRPIVAVRAQSIARIPEKQPMMRKHGKQSKGCMTPPARFAVRTPEQVPALLQSFRKAAGLTQAEVAARLGVTQQTMSAMERNADSVSVARLMKLLAVLGVELVLSQEPAAAPEVHASARAAGRASARSRRSRKAAW
jgi:HTH-type transcriptional regulator/antitoxin HipB